MSLPRDGLHPVPVETARVAHAAFPDGNVSVRLCDEVGTLFDDDLFTGVYAREGQPALHPWQLALVSVMQFMENLSDRQAAQAVRARIDWKDALGLELTDEGFHDSVLSEFRTRLVQGSLEQVLLAPLLTPFSLLDVLSRRFRDVQTVLVPLPLSVDTPSASSGTGRTLELKRTTLTEQSS